MESEAGNQATKMDKNDTTGSEIANIQQYRPVGNLTKLPLEIRLMIYEHVIAGRTFNLESYRTQPLLTSVPPREWFEIPAFGNACREMRDFAFARYHPVAFTLVRRASPEDFVIWPKVGCGGDRGQVCGYVDDERDFVGARVHPWPRGEVLRITSLQYEDTTEGTRDYFRAFVVMKGPRPYLGGGGMAGTDRANLGSGSFAPC